MTPEQIINSVLDDLGADSTGATIIAALHAAGLKLVAREPTKEMKRAFWESGPTDKETFGAMWDAAP